MNRTFSWKALGVAVGLFLAAGIICLATGNTDMASALFVVAAFEAVFGAIVIGIVRSRQKQNHATTP